MGDLVLRVSILVQQGFICRRCGFDLPGDPAGEPSSCASCRIDEAQEAEGRAGGDGA